jgi:hypothetical protein
MRPAVGQQWTQWHNTLKNYIRITEPLPTKQKVPEEAREWWRVAHQRGSRIAQESTNDAGGYTNGSGVRRS